jgi:hypothetical protein
MAYPITHLTETQSQALLTKLNEIIAKQEAIIESFANAIKANPFYAFSQMGDKALVAAAVIDVLKQAASVVESEGVAFNALLSAQRLSRMIVLENEAPKHWSGLLSNQVGTAERQAKAMLVALLLEVVEQ